MLLGIYPNKLKTYLHTKTCTQMFMAALFTTTKPWKQPRCPSMGQWINKIVIESYNRILLSDKKKWAIKAQKNTGTLNAYCYVKEANLTRLHTIWFQLYDILEKAKITETIKQSVVIRGWGRDEWVEHRGFLVQWNYSVWYCNDGYRSSYFCQNPQKVQHKE